MDADGDRGYQTTCSKECDRLTWHMVVAIQSDMPHLQNLCMPHGCLSHRWLGSLSAITWRSGSIAIAVVVLQKH